VQRFYEWLLVGAHHAIGYGPLFGDTHYLKRFEVWRTARMFTMERFSQRAAAHVAWLVQARSPRRPT